MDNKTEATTKAVTRQTTFYLDFQYIRLLYDVMQINKKLEENEQRTSEGENIFKKIGTSIRNTYSATVTAAMKKDTDTAKTNLRKFTGNHSAYTYTESEEALKSFTEKTRAELAASFAKDEYGLEKLSLAIPAVIDNEYSYIYSDSGLALVSECLYGEKEALASIRERVEETYRFLGKQPLTYDQRKTLIGIGILSAAVCVALPFLAAGGIGASAAATTAALTAAGFGDMQLGVGVLAAVGVLAGASGVAVGYLMMKEQSKIKLKDDFRKMSFDSATMMLTIRSMMEEEALRHGMPNIMMKERLDELYKMIADLRADTDYMCFVEKQNTKENMKKQELFHRFNLKMAKILEI